jgi:tRNA (guanosine-2'-O-)-methyltransferase
VSRQLDGTGMKRLHRSWREHTSGRLALILDGLGTPVNVGSILRTAAAYRVDRVWLGGPTPGPEVGGVAKTALGTERYLDLVASPSLDAVTAAHQQGYQVIAIELTDDAKPLHEAVAGLGPDVCLVVGHEDHGVSKPVLSAVDGCAYLPMLGKVGSLNVATAAAIAVYELRRRDWLPGGSEHTNADPGAAR